MKPSTLVCVAVGLAAIVAAGALPASAHHSFAMFEHTDKITLKGVVTKFQWTNPHAFIEMSVSEGDKWAGRRYTVECASPNVLSRLGWKFNTIKEGDMVVLLINPLKDGKPGGMLEQATLPDGRTLGDGNPPGGVFAR